MEKRKKKERKKKKEIGKGIEEVLKEAREKKGWSYVEVVEKLNNSVLDEKEIKKWEIGLKYPDLDMIYKLSELYQIPSQELIQAKNNSYEKGLESVHMITVKWICYFFNVSIHVAYVIVTLVYAAALVLALLYFVDMASRVKGK